MDTPAIVLIGPSGGGFSTTLLVQKIIEAKELGVDVVAVKVGSQVREDKINNVEKALTTNLQQYIEINFNTRGKIFKTGGQSELMLVDDIDLSGHPQFNRRSGRFGGTNFTPPKKKRKKR